MYEEKEAKENWCKFRIFRIEVMQYFKYKCNNHIITMSNWVVIIICILIVVGTVSNNNDFNKKY